MENTNIQVIGDFIRTFSCVHSITSNLSRALNSTTDPRAFHSVVGFSGGVSLMGDTCGAANGGVIVLGDKYSSLPPDRLYLLCSEYFSRLEAILGTPNCGRLHGGRHLSRDFRRSLMTGRIIKCVEVLHHGTDILKELSRMADRNDYSALDPEKSASIRNASDYFEQSGFHCSGTVIRAIAGRNSLPSGIIQNFSKGFIGGIGLNGTLCGAISGAVLCLGLANNVDIAKSGYADTMNIFFRGLIVNDKVFDDEKHFPPAKLFRQCREVYTHVENKYGAVHCSDILNLRLDQRKGLDQYIQESKMELCRAISGSVVEITNNILKDACS